MGVLTAGLSSQTYALGLAFALISWTILLRQAGQLQRAPLLLHNAAWAVALGVLGLNLVHFTADTPYAWILITGGIAAFNIAMLLPSAAGHERTPTIADDPPLISRSLFRGLMAGYTIGVLYYLRVVGSIVGLSTLIHNPSVARIQAGQVNALLPLPVKLLYYLAPFLLVLTLNRWSVRPQLTRTTQLLTIIYLVVTLLLGVQRTELFTAGLWEIALLLIAPPPGVKQAWQAAKRTRLRRTIGVLVMVAVTVGAFQFLAVKLNKTGATIDSVQQNVSPALRGTPYASIPIYLSGGIAAFSNLAESRNFQAPPVGTPASQIVGDYNPQTWGRATFQAPLKLIPVVPHWNSVAPFTFVPFEFNVYTWFEPYYRDFRAPGVLLLTFLSGLLIGSVHKRRHRSSAWMFGAALLLGYTALAPFTNRLIEVFTFEYLTLLALLGRYGPSRRPPQTRTPPMPPLLIRNRPVQVDVATPGLDLTVDW